MIARWRDDASGQPAGGIVLTPRLGRLLSACRDALERPRGVLAQERLGVVERPREGLRRGRLAMTTVASDQPRGAARNSSVTRCRATRGSRRAATNVIAAAAAR